MLTKQLPENPAQCLCRLLLTAYFEVETSEESVRHSRLYMFSMLREDSTALHEQRRSPASQIGTAKSNPIKQAHPQIPLDPSCKDNVVSFLGQCHGTLQYPLRIFELAVDPQSDTLHLQSLGPFVARTRCFAGLLELPNRNLSVATAQRAMSSFHQFRKVHVYILCIDNCKEQIILYNTIISPGKPAILTFMKIITAGSYYLDIDAYAGIIAYAELLRKQGINAQAVSTAPLNESITETVRSWPVDLKRVYKPSPDDTFTLIDASTPGQLDTIVDEAKIDLIVNHYTKDESYWKQHPGVRVDIDQIGAACTLVYEYWRDAKLLDQMSQTSARLLVCGILDNTLNFGSATTTARDKAAYDDLFTRTELPADWPAHYFGECQTIIDSDPVNAMLTDSKMIEFKGLDQTLKVGQLVVWDTNKVLHEDRGKLKASLAMQDAGWFINIVSIGERKSYFVCDNPELQLWLSGLLDIQFRGDIAPAGRMWLRKEITRQDLIFSGETDPAS